jgi:hypothetical protein
MWRRVDVVWTDVSEERRFTQDLHGATSQKTAFFIVTAVITSDATCVIFLCRSCAWNTFSIRSGPAVMALYFVSVPLREIILTWRHQFLCLIVYIIINSALSCAYLFESLPSVTTLIIKVLLVSYSPFHIHSQTKQKTSLYIVWYVCIGTSVRHRVVDIYNSFSDLKDSILMSNT